MKTLLIITGLVIPANFGPILNAKCNGRINKCLATMHAPTPNISHGNTKGKLTDLPASPVTLPEFYGKEAAKKTFSLIPVPGLLNTTNGTAEGKPIPFPECWRYLNVADGLGDYEICTTVTYFSSDVLEPLPGAPSSGLRLLLAVGAARQRR
jgi:hypothetical protein